MSTNSRLALAIEIANNTHAGQTDRGGHPYILHPLRVMFAVEEVTKALIVEPSEFSIGALQIIAVLHDVVEDSDDPANAAALIQAGFGDTVAHAVDLLSRRSLDGSNKGDKGREPYDEYIDRLLAGRSVATCLVKLADLSDNMDLTRIANPTQTDYDRFYKYAMTMKRIQNVVSGRSMLLDPHSKCHPSAECGQSVPGSVHHCRAGTR